MTEVRASIDGLANLSRGIQRNTEDLRRLTTDIERTIGSTVWTGQAANKFKETWTQQKRNLEQMASLLEEVKREVDERTERLRVFEA